jgi:hypothetical protein
MYDGNAFPIIFGPSGLHTDDPPSLTPANHLSRAENVELRNGYIEKATGSVRYNTSSLGSGVAVVFDYWPTIIDQFLVAVTKDGKVWRFRNPDTATEITAAGDAPSAIQPSSQTHIVTGGAEETSNNKKLFIFNGDDPIQVISGTAMTRSNLSRPATEWEANSYPTFGVVHRNRLYVFGSKNDPHRSYASLATDHEDFTTDPMTFQIFPGEGEFVQTAFTFKGRLFCMKYPMGLYYLEDSSTDETEWFWRRVQTSVGASSIHGAIEVLNDALIMNPTASITSIGATQEFGDVKSADVLSAMRMSKSVRDLVNPEGAKDCWAIYYDDKKIAMFTYRSAGSIQNDRILFIDFNIPSQPRAIWDSRDQANCLAQRKDSLGIMRPMYGSNDGYIYLMDQVDRMVGSSGFEGLFQTQVMDFRERYPEQAHLDKNFHFLECEFLQSGEWNVDVDIYINGEFSETVSFKQLKQPGMGRFRLDKNRLDSGGSFRYTKEIHGQGRTIAFVVRNDGDYETFKIASLTVYFKFADVEQG